MKWLIHSQAQHTSHQLRQMRRQLSEHDKSEHHSIDHLKEKGVEKGSGPCFTLRGRELSVLNQTNTGTVSNAILRRLLTDGLEVCLGLSQLSSVLRRLQIDRAQVCLGLSQLYYTVLKKLQIDRAQVCLGLSQLYYTILKRLQTERRCAWAFPSSTIPS